MNNVADLVKLQHVGTHRKIYLVKHRKINLVKQRELTDPRKIYRARKNKETHRGTDLEKRGGRSKSC